MIEGALAAPNAPEIEAQHGKVPVREGIIELVDDLMVHRAAELGMGVEHDADRGVALARRVITALDAPRGAGEDDLGHCNLDWNLRATRGRVLLSALDGYGEPT